MAGIIDREAHADIEVNELDFATNTETYLDNLFDKSSVVRANSTQRWIEYLTDKFDHDLVNTNVTNLIDVCAKAIQRGEIDHACDFLNIIVITLGAEGSVYADSCITALRNALSGEISAFAKSKIFKTLGVVTFFWNVESADSTIGVLKSLNDVVNNFCTETNLDEHEQQLLLTVLHIWTFLLTVVDDDNVLEFITETQILSSFNDLIINNNDYKVKYAAGKGLAYISNILDETMNDPDIGHYDHTVSTSDIVSNLRNSKKPKNYSGVELSQVADNLENGEAPSLVITVDDIPYTFDDWLRISQIDILRSVTQSGFLHHMLNNSLFSELLEIEVRNVINRPEKRAVSEYYAEKKKSRKINRNNERNKKRAALNE
jgi:hypothetical protein